MTRLLQLLAAVAMLAALGRAEAQQHARVLDGFDSVAPWSTALSDGVSGAISLTQGHEGGAARFTYNFNGGAGYASMRRALPLRFPENYEISFLIRGEGPANDLEFKLADQSGENVWWRVQRGFTPTGGWQRITIRKRHIEFAWGPTQDRALRDSAFLEFVISAGSGGRGAIEIDQLTIRELQPVPAAFPAILGRATSGANITAALDNNLDTAWRSDAAGAQSVTFDLGVIREFGGVVLRWAPNAHAMRYALESSLDGEEWRTHGETAQGDGGVDPWMLPESEARYIRLRLLETNAPAYALAEFQLRDLAFGATPTNFLQALAREAPRGAYPRGFVGEQTYWTLVGVDGGGPRSALLGEEGAVELGRGGVSVEPFIVANGRLHSWADVTLTPSLRDKYLPIPSVEWRTAQWRMTTTSAANGDAAVPHLAQRYELENLTDQPQELTLILAVRPFQVNPPQQFLNTPGGFSPIRDIQWTGATLRVNNRDAIHPSVAPDAVQTVAFDDGAWIASPGMATSATSEQGFAAAALRYTVRLGPRQRAEFGFAAPLAERAEIEVPSRITQAWLQGEQDAVADAWRRQLDHVRFTVPDEGERRINTIRSSIAYMLMSRDLAALQPGTRSYARSWIRDGAMMSEGLLRVGLDRPVREYLDWYRPYQFENGKVPCCVDARGADPVPENDSHGELIHLAAIAYRYTSDRAVLDDSWPHVERAIHYMEELRTSERTAENQTPERRMLYGLMPPSISHEGYSARPAYSYWDDFWALRGYIDAVELAEARGDAAAATRIAAQRDEFRTDLFNSIRASAAHFNVGYIPGAADLGDFDATSTTIALAPGGQQTALPQDLMHGTFERYWQNFVARRDGTGGPWEAYTPYELRLVGTFARLGWRERANDTLAFFFGDQRPAAWNHWAEVVGREERTPRFIGDMPHGWVASDYLRSALDMFAHERSEDGALVLAAGLPEAWFAGDGIAVENLETPFGTLDYSIRRDGSAYLVRIGGDARPPGGFVIAAPFEDGARLCINHAPIMGPEVVLMQHRARVRVAPC
jgi:hypothetical protein